MSEIKDSRRGVLVLLPAFNEERCIEAVVVGLRKEHPDVEVLVVDDGSTDRTATLARASGASVLALPFNLGVGGAVRAGFVYARDHGFESVVQMDADGQHHSSDIKVLLDGLGRADVVVGSRFAGAGVYGVHGPRRWAMWSLSRLVSRTAGTRLTDVTSGFRATNRRGIELFAVSYPAEYLGDTVESLMIASRSGLVLCQVPVAMTVRAGGMPSQSRARSVLHLGRTVFSVFLALVRTWSVPLPPDRLERV